MAVLAILLVLVAVLISPPAVATDSTGAAAAPAPAPVPPLTERLHHAFSITLDDAAGDEDGSGIMECWGALAQLGSCTSEILLFLFNGESYIGDECCRAIRGATRHCWPAMLASVGFTAEQADVLRGFCEGEAANAPPAAGTNAPPPAGKQ